MLANRTNVLIPGRSIGYYECERVGMESVEVLRLDRLPSLGVKRNTPGVVKKRSLSFQNRGVKQYDRDSYVSGHREGVSFP